MNQASKRVYSSSLQNRTSAIHELISLFPIKNNYMYLLLSFTSLSSSIPHVPVRGLEVPAIILWFVSGCVLVGVSSYLENAKACGGRWCGWGIYVYISKQNHFLRPCFIHKMFSITASCSPDKVSCLFPLGLVFSWGYQN